MNETKTVEYVRKERKLLTTTSAAKYLGISYGSLVKLRLNSFGPKYVRIGIGKGKLFYCECDLDAWIDEKRNSSNSGGLICSLGNINSRAAQKLLNDHGSYTPIYIEEEIGSFFNMCLKCEKLVDCRLSAALGLNILIRKG